MASNTSSLSLTEIGEGVERKDKIIGMHFFIFKLLNITINFYKNFSQK
ncbi:MAG: 3-hydroxyacyl-CoA dehydrogenase NAD-binding domain-containing protein [Candidatus Lokiarchaeota archaeon]